MTKRKCKMTNGDKIRNMTDDELAYFLNNIETCCYPESGPILDLFLEKKNYEIKNHIPFIRMWLRKE